MKLVLTLEPSQELESEIKNLLTSGEYTHRELEVYFMGMMAMQLFDQETALGTLKDFNIVD